ncbi:MAG: sulfate permease [Firmicutes bacterium]|nr:sulfate permease [Bacillota bacterium]
MLKPKLITTLKDYSWERFVSDLIAGIIVGIVALPLAIAFAIASGVSPEKGIFTAIIAGFIISTLGGSRVQIGGPTGAFVVIVYGIVQKYGLDGLTIATIMAGIILVIMGVARFGSMIKFIPYPVIAGFTSGIAVIIFSTQIKDFFGLTMGEVPSEFLHKIAAYVANFSSVNYWALMVSVVTLLIIIVLQKVSRRIPGSLIALVFCTALVYLFKLPVETIGNRFGQIPSMLPAPVFPKIDFQIVRNLIGPSMTIAVLAGIEALLSAVVADGMIGDKHRSNMELVANGVANIVAPFFGGIPATGAIARTATNIKNGGRTPVAGIIHSIVLVLILLFFGKWASLIPLSCLAAILVVVAYNMSEWRSFVRLLKSPRSDVMVLLFTFGLTVLFDLTVAIEVGLLMAVFLFMRRMALVTNVDVITKELEDHDDIDTLEEKLVPEGVEVYEINGPLFFGAAYKFEEALNLVKGSPQILIIRMRNVPAIDSTGLHILQEIIKRNRKNQMTFILSGVQEQPLKALEQSGFVAKIGAENICKNIEASLKRARKILDLNANELKMDA